MSNVTYILNIYAFILHEKQILGNALVLFPLRPHKTCVRRDVVDAYNIYRSRIEQCIPSRNDDIARTYRGGSDTISQPTRRVNTDNPSRDP